MSSHLVANQNGGETQYALEELAHYWKRKLPDGKMSEMNLAALTSPQSLQAESQKLYQSLHAPDLAPSTVLVSSGIPKPVACPEL